MISDGFCGCPDFQRLRAISVSFQLLRVDESIDRRHVPFLQDLQNILSRVDTSHSGREQSVQRQIIEGDGEFLSKAGPAKYPKEGGGKKTGRGRLHRNFSSQEFTSSAKER